MRTILVMLLAVALAGCSGGGGSISTASDQEAVDASPIVRHNLTFVDATAERMQVFSGDFQVQDGPGMQPAGAPLGTPTQTHDITGLLGAGHNWVTAELTVGMDDNDFALSFVPDDFGFVWTSDTTDPQVIEAAIVATGSVALAVAFQGTAPNDVADHADGADYEVTVTVSQDPLRIPSGIALEIPMSAPGTTVTFTAADGTVPDVLVFDPGDQFIGKLDGGATVEYALADNGTTGDYVFMPIGHGSFYSLHVEAPSEGGPDARIVTQVVTPGDVETIPSGQEHELQFDLGSYAVQPLQVGVVVIVPSAASNVHARILDPSGEERAYVALNGVIEAQTFGFDFTVMGDETLLPGAYTIDYFDGASTGDVTVQGFVVQYQR